MIRQSFQNINPKNIVEPFQNNAGNNAGITE